MNRFGKIAVCFAGGLALNAGLCAAELSLTNNPLPNDPYVPIVVRNVFGLLPPPDPHAEETNDILKDLPKITVNGIYAVFDRAKVLFKTSGGAPKPGQPAKDKFYRLSEGEGQDDIEVTHIDQKNGLVTFNNHGAVQELPLVAATGSAPATGGNPGVPEVKSNPGGSAPGPDGIIRFSGRGGGFGAGGGPGNSSGAAGGANNGVNMNFSGSTQGRIYQPEQTDLSPEAAVILLEKNKADAQAEGNPNAAFYPPTVLTPLLNGDQQQQ